MVSRKRYKSWDADHENVRVRLAAGRMNLSRARAALSQARFEHDRAVRAQARAAKKTEEFRGDTTFAQRRL